VPTGEGFTMNEKEEVARALRIAEKESGLPASVYVGDLGPSSRDRALLLHGALGSAAGAAVLIAVDPGTRKLEIVTGHDLRRHLDDQACALGALAMTSQLSSGDLAGGIVNGIRTLAEHARHPRVLHLDEP
jgi:Domain of unknown function (DUF5130)